MIRKHAQSNVLFFSFFAPRSRVTHSHLPLKVDNRQPHLSSFSFIRHTYLLFEIHAVEYRQLVDVVILSSRTQPDVQ